MIKAKPIVKNKFWILRDGNRKVGEVNAIQGGFSVTVNNREAALNGVYFAYFTVTFSKNPKFILYNWFCFNHLQALLYMWHLANYRTGQLAR